MDLVDLDPDSLSGLSDDEFRDLAAKALSVQELDRQHNQIVYYQPASAKARQLHACDAKIVGVGGGNRSSKTESCLVELVALACGVFPRSIEEDCHRKFRGPINIRVCVVSLTTVLHPIILPKLQWWKWIGPSRPGGDLGHWGWVPKECLIQQQWDKSWSEKLRTLRIKCRDPHNHDKILGESQIQFMSYDQDAPDFASGTFHHILHDEVPTLPIWRENQSRVMDVNGRIMLAMTWPDDPSIPVDWLYDEVYDKGRPGPHKDPNYAWFELFTTENQHLDTKDIERRAKGLDARTRQVRIYGQPIRFSNRIHPLFTDFEQIWCFSCGDAVSIDSGTCNVCGGTDVELYCHVRSFDIGSWPCVFLLDPHPRKPHMFCWAAIDPSDDIWVVAEEQVDGDCTDVRNKVDEIEGSLGLRTTLRLVDPNMGASPASSKRGITWQSEFYDAGLVCELADDAEVGRKRLNQMLKPDKLTRQPRFHVHLRCANFVSQIKRYIWDEHKQSLEKDVKQKPRAKNDDYPTLAKYLMNYEPTFTFLNEGAPIIGRPGTRKGAY